MMNVLNLSQRLLTGSLAVVTALAVLTAGGDTVRAQSASRIPSGPRTQSAKNSVALEGYCPVCVIKIKKWVRGNPHYAATYDGKTYYFPGEDQKQMFLADPAKYVPALGGDCTVCYANMGQRVPGNIRHASLYNNRLFLFRTADQKREFVAHQKRYADVDLALGGKCAVCQVEMNKDVPGKPEIAAFYQGFRYLFPSEQQRKMFLANPAKYAVKPTATRHTSIKTPAGRMLTVKGTSGCAGCDHGVVPIGSPNELGLAVNANDGKVYVVENAHQLYPDVYEKRFEGLLLEVAGKVLKQDGKITWIQPSKLRVVN